jgi:DNA-3-methyladenine glycosylase II
MRQVGEARYVRETAALVRKDRVLRAIVGRVGPCTLAPSRDHFLTLAEAILWQQLSWKAARSIHERLLETLGNPRPRPADFTGAGESVLARAGVSRRKIRYLKGLAAFFEENRFPARTIRKLADEDIVGMLTQIDGVGVWTAEMFLIFGLNRLDVFPSGDLGLKKAIGSHYGFDGLRDTKRVEAVALRWRPYRTIGTWYMWSSADSKPLSDEPSGAGG